uniref:Uncharacterized protein n=1 Tax=Meloidogyne enterolobii TaxID=390850 RepID=A0A6V7W660_MELEN|nr:unnamed protein product [Meloidogyne enterolobii]
MFFQIRKFQNYLQKCLFYLLISNILFSNIFLLVNGTIINSTNFNEFEGEQQAAKAQFLASTGTAILAGFGIISVLALMFGFVYIIVKLFGSRR